MNMQGTAVQLGMHVVALCFIHMLTHCSWQQTPEVIVGEAHFSTVLNDWNAHDVIVAAQNTR